MKYKLVEKPHIVNKLINLTPEQKQQINAFFTTHRNMENEIDWNKGQKLTYQDFKNVMDANYNSFNNKKKRVKFQGVDGLSEEDYGKVDTGDDAIIGLVPYNHDAAELIESDSLMGVQGHWCIGYQKDDQYWDSYTGNGDTFLMLIMPEEKEKVCLQVNGSITVWTKEDSRRDLNWFCMKFGQDAQKVKSWCRQAVDLAEGKIERTKRVTKEVEPYWWVSNEEDHITIGLEYTEKEFNEDGDSWTTDTESYFAKADIYLLDQKSPPPEDLSLALQEIQFNFSEGIGLFIKSTTEDSFDEAQQHASNHLEGEWRDEYSEDAIAEIYEYVFGVRRSWKDKERVFSPDYLIFDISINDLSDDSNFRSIIYDSLSLLLREEEIDSVVEEGDYKILILNPNFDYQNKPREDWEGLDMNTPKMYDDPRQQYLNYDEAFRRRMLRLLGQPHRSNQNYSYGL